MAKKKPDPASKRWVREQIAEAMRDHNADVADAQRAVYQRLDRVESEIAPYRDYATVPMLEAITARLSALEAKPAEEAKGEETPTFRVGDRVRARDIPANTGFCDFRGLVGTVVKHTGSPGYVTVRLDNDPCGQSGYLRNAWLPSDLEPAPAPGDADLGEILLAGAEKTAETIRILTEQRDAARKEVEGLKAELAEAEASRDLQGKRNREVADALGLHPGSTWHDLGERVATLRKELADLKAWRERVEAAVKPVRKWKRDCGCEAEGASDEDALITKACDGTCGYSVGNEAIVGSFWTEIGAPR